MNRPPYLGMMLSTLHRLKTIGRRSCKIPSKSIERRIQQAALLNITASLPFQTLHLGAQMLRFGLSHQPLVVPEGVEFTNSGHALSEYLEIMGGGQRITSSPGSCLFTEGNTAVSFTFWKQYTQDESGPCSGYNNHMTQYNLAKISCHLITRRLCLMNLLFFPLASAIRITASLCVFVCLTLPMFSPVL